MAMLPTRDLAPPLWNVSLYMHCHEKLEVCLAFAVYQLGTEGRPAATFVPPKAEPWPSILFKGEQSVNCRSLKRNSAQLNHVREIRKQQFLSYPAGADIISLDVKEYFHEPPKQVSFASDIAHEGSKQCLAV